MSEDVQTGQEIVEETTSAMPTEQKPIETVVDEEQEALENSKNPERTKAYIEKLKAEKKALEAQITPQPPQRSVFEAYLPHLGDAPQTPVQTQVQAPANLSTAQVNQITQGLVDESGYVDAAVLQRELDKTSLALRQAEEANARTARLEQQIQRFELDRQTMALYQQYPELDPSNAAYSPEAYRLVKNELLDQLVRTGRQDGLKAAADMSKYFRKNKAAEQKVEQLQQATVTTGSGTGNSKRATSTQELEDLKIRSRTDRNALAERLRRSGY